MAFPVTHHDVLDACAKVFAVTTDELCGSARSRGPRAVYTARMVAMRMMHCCLEMSHEEIARLFKREARASEYASEVIGARFHEDKELYEKMLCVVDLLFDVEMAGKRRKGRRAA